MCLLLDPLLLRNETLLQLQLFAEDDFVMIMMIVIMMMTSQR